MKKKRVLVIGGTGFIGSAVSKELLKAGCEVAVMHRGHRALSDQALHSVVGDRHDQPFLRKALADFAPEVIIDMVAYTPQDAWALRSFRNKEAKHIVLISSGDVYRAYEVFRQGKGRPVRVPLLEGDPLRTQLFPYREGLLPDNEENNLLYNYEKIIAEELLIQADGLAATVMRLPAVYGENDKQHKLSAYLQPMLSGEKEIFLDERKANWRWTRGYVRNIAHGIGLAALRDATVNKIYNIGNAHPLTERELVEEIAALTGWKGHLVLLPKEQLPKEYREPFHFEQHLVLDTSRIRHELDYNELFDWKTGMQQTIAFEEGMI